MILNVKTEAVHYMLRNRTDPVCCTSPCSGMHCNQRLTHCKLSWPGSAWKESKALQNSSGRCPLSSSFQALLLSTASLDAGTMKFACRAVPSKIGPDGSQTRELLTNLRLTALFDTGCVRSPIEAVLIHSATCCMAVVAVSSAASTSGLKSSGVLRAYHGWEAKG